MLFTILQQHSMILQEYSLVMDDGEFLPSSFWHANHETAKAVPEDSSSTVVGSRRTSFRQDICRSDNHTVAEFVHNSMARELGWYRSCMKDNATRRTSSVPRSCPPTMDQDAAINGNPLKEHHCSVTEAIELEWHQGGDGPSRQEKKWKLKTLDAAGNYKVIGGDELYVSFTVYNSNSTDPTAVAIVKDHQDGSYGLEFVNVPSKSSYNPELPKNDTAFESFGSLEIYLQYTCFMGTLHQPLKDGWKAGGASNMKLIVENVPVPPMQSWRERLQTRGGVIRNPSTDASTPSDPITSLSKFDKTIFFGDSLIAQMVVTYSHPVVFFYYRKAVTHGNADIAVSVGSLDTIAKKLEEWEGDQLRRQPNSALVLGSSSWDMLHPSEWQGPAFEKHLQGCRALVEHVRNTYPHVTILWRLPTAVHVHKAKGSCFTLSGEPSRTIETTTPKAKVNMNKPRNPCVDILRYASISRIEYLYQQQLQLMLEELKVSVVDLYELSYLSPHHLRQGDAQHYSIDWNFHNFNEYLYPDDRDEIRRFSKSDDKK